MAHTPAARSPAGKPATCRDTAPAAGRRRGESRTFPTTTRTTSMFISAVLERLGGSGGQREAVLLHERDRGGIHGRHRVDQHAARYEIELLDIRTEPSGAHHWPIPSGVVHSSQTFSGTAGTTFFITSRGSSALSDVICTCPLVRHRRLPHGDGLPPRRGANRGAHCRVLLRSIRERIGVFADRASASYPDPHVPQKLRPHVVAASLLPVRLEIASVRERLEIPPCRLFGDVRA